MSLDTLDLLIGLAVVYLTLSLVVTAFREAIEARLKSRARHLALGIMRLLNSREDAERFYKSPLIAALYRTDSSSTENKKVPLPGEDFKGFTGRTAPLMLVRAMFSRPKEADLPSYIPATTFVHGLIALTSEMSGGKPQDKVTLQSFSDALDRLSAEGHVWAWSLHIVIASAGDDFNKAIKNIEGWYDDSMDRVSGWYRRESHFIAFWMGLALAFALNVDSIFLAKHLATHDLARTRLVEMAVKQSEGIQQGLDQPKSAEGAKQQSDIAQKIRDADDRVFAAMRDLSELGLPIGWNRAKWRAMTDPVDFSLILKWIPAVMGWFITALALSLGAPFWFDVLNKFMVIRSTVKPKEKSREEASEDRQK